MKTENNKGHVIEHFASKVTKAAGSTAAFVTSLCVVIGWALAGKFFHYSESWQLFINTCTTITTFLMVFLIQKSQNKDSLAIQLKLNELLSSHEPASKKLVDVESMTEDELKVIQKYYAQLNASSQKEDEHSEKENQRRPLQQPLRRMRYVKTRHLAGRQAHH